MYTALLVSFFGPKVDLQMSVLTMVHVAVPMGYEIVMMHPQALVQYM